MGFREWGAISRQSRSRPIAKRAVTMASRKRGISNGFCCNLGSIKLRPVALRPRQEPALPNCHVLTVECEWPGWPGAVPGVLRTEVHQRVSARFAVRPACLLEGPILDWRAGMPERGTTGTITVSNHYVRPESRDGKQGLGRWPGSAVPDRDQIVTVPHGMAR